MEQTLSTEHQAPLIDRLGRVHTSLRISVTDRCNIRCFYCMPGGHVRFRPRAEILTYEEIERFVRVVSLLGIRKLRITGGEPLVRAELWRLIERLARLDRVEEVALTTNGILLPEQAHQLKDAGLTRLNISLDTLNEETFRKISRREGLSRVLDGIQAAQEVGFKNLRLNALSIRGISEEDIIPLAQFAKAHELELRFIEFMPLDADQQWQTQSVLSGAEVREILEDAFGPLIASVRPNPSQPAVDFHFADGRGRIGFINPVTEPFCGQCDRLRLTAEGKVRNCLFSTEEWDLRRFLRNSPDPPEVADAQIMDCVRTAIGSKKAGHGIDSEHFLRPQRAMYQIGG